jgi:hypothetical protein
MGFREFIFVLRTACEFCDNYEYPKAKAKAEGGVSSP